MIAQNYSGQNKNGFQKLGVFSTAPEIATGEFTLNAMVVSVFSQLSDILHIVAANIDVEKHQVAIYILFAQDVFQIFLGGNESFGQARLQIPRVECKVEHRDAGIAEAVRNIRSQQPSIGRDINPEAFLRRVVHNLMDEVGPQQRLAAHQREDAAAIVVQPVDRAPG